MALKSREYEVSSRHQGTSSREYGVGSWHKPVWSME
jgi:hypothetical protein